VVEDLASAPWLRRLIVVTLLAGLVLLSFEVLRPFIVPALWAAIIGYVTWPLHERVLQFCRGRRAIAALLTTLAVTIAVVAPIVWLSLLLRTEAVRGYQELTALLARGVQLPDVLLRLPAVGEWLREFTERAANDPNALRAELSAFFESSAKEIGRIAGGLGRNAGKVLIAIISLFFAYRDGDRFAAQLARVLEQLLGPRVHDYLVAIGQTVKAVVYGLVFAALAQGSLAGIGYWAAGLETPVFLAALTTVAAFIPFAVPLVWGSAGLWLLATGNTVAGFGLLIWGFGAVSWIDNVVRPLVISNATRIPFLFVLFGVLGGVIAFGLVGLFLGPVILAVLIAIWREWSSVPRGN
jgi:predicted PurR-regulated permease PerM